jgi:hypothetical protein
MGRKAKIATANPLEIEATDKELARLERRTAVQPCETAEQATPCFVWTGCKCRDGYGKIKIRGKPMLTHRFAFAVFKRALAGGEDVDHVCLNRACWNPAHLRTIARARHAARTNKRRTYAEAG